MKFLIHSFQSTIRFLLILSLSAMVMLTFGDVLGRGLFAVAAKEAVYIQEVSQELLIPRYYLYTVMSVSGFISGVAALLPESNNNMNNSDSAFTKSPLSEESGL